MIKTYYYHDFIKYFELAKDQQIKCNVPNFMSHKDIDYNIKIKMLKNCEHNIPVEASSLALEFIKKNLYK